MKVPSRSVPTVLRSHEKKLHYIICLYRWKVLLELSRLLLQGNN